MMNFGVKLKNKPEGYCGSGGNGSMRLEWLHLTESEVGEMKEEFRFKGTMNLGGTKEWKGSERCFKG